MVVPTAEPSDETLAARAAAGDDPAFEAIVMRYQARVFRLACRLTSDTDAPDVLQETFLQVYRHLSSFRGESQFGTWLYRIATNASAHAPPRAGTAARGVARGVPAALRRRRNSRGHASTSCRSLHVPTSCWTGRFWLRRREPAIARLPDMYRDAFVLRDLEEMSTADVAQALGVEPATVRQRVHRARLMLRGYLSDLVGVKP